MYCHCNATFDCEARSDQYKEHVQRPCVRSVLDHLIIQLLQICISFMCFIKFCTVTLLLSKEQCKIQLQYRYFTRREKVPAGQFTYGQLAENVV